MRRNRERVNKRKTAWPFFTFRLKKIIPSSARLATSTKCEVLRAGFFRVSYHTARRKRRTVCPHKELHSAFIPFITSERMRYKSLRTDKRKTHQAFFASRFIGKSEQCSFAVHPFIFIKNRVIYSFVNDIYCSGFLAALSQ